MHKIYDKIILAGAALLLAGGVFLYLQKSSMTTSLGASVEVETGDHPYAVKAVPASSHKEANWPDAPEQSTGWRFDVFTPPKIYIDENGLFSEEGWEPPKPPPPFGIYLADISRNPYRIQLEGYIEEDRSDPSKTLLLMVNQETQKQVRARPGDEKPEAEFKLLSFDIERIRDADNNIEVVATAVILDQRLNEEVTLTHGKLLYNEGVSIVVRSNVDSSFEVVLEEAPAEFEGPIGQYNLLDFDPDRSVIRVERQVAEGENPDVRTLTISSASPSQAKDTPKQEAKNAFDQLF